VDGAIFPLDRQLGIEGQTYSRTLTKHLVWLSALVPYAQCQQILARIGGHTIPLSSLYRQVQQASPRLQTYVESQQAIVQPDKLTELPSRTAAVKGVSLDGGMVNIRGEGWRELKIGVVFDIATRFEPHPTRG